MTNATLSTDMDAFLTAANNAAARTALGAMASAGGSFTGLTGAGFRDTNSGTGFDVTLGFTSSVELTAGRALTIDMGNVAHTIALGTTAGTITFPNEVAVTVAGLQIANVFSVAQTIDVASGTMLTLKIGGSDRFTFTSGMLAAAGADFTLRAPSGGYCSLNANGTASGAAACTQQDTGLFVGAAGLFGFTTTTSGGTGDTFFMRTAAASARMGKEAASSQVSQIFGACGARIGTDTNTTPTNTFTLAGPYNTGTGTGGDLRLGVYGTNGASGTAIGTLNTVLTIVAARKVVNISSIPTSSAGLSAGDVYSNAGILTIV